MPVRAQRQFVAVALVCGAAFLLPAANALAVPEDNPNASCVGSGSSALAPGQGLFEAGARAAVSHFTNAAAELAGTAPGQLVIASAQDKGTAVECFPSGPPGS